VTSYLVLLDSGKREVPVEVQALGPHLYQVTLGGRTRTVDAFQHDSGSVSLLVDGASYAVLVDDRGRETRMQVGDSVYPLEVLDERRLRTRRTARKFTVDGRQAIRAPLPGKVLRVLRRPGEAVREGEGLVVLEAMDMENELRSPKDGKVVELLVEEGQSVEGGARLAAVE